MDVLYGPRPVQKTGNVSVPRELLEAVGVEPGTDSVHFALIPEVSGTIILIPSRQAARIMGAVIKALGENA